MIVIFIGPPGSGKSTQAKKVAKKLDVPSISMGEVLRDASETGTILGKKAEKYINKGKLIPSRLIRALTKFRLEESDCENGFVLDGSPRKVEEAVILDSYFKKKEWEISRVIVIEISRDESIRRLIERGGLPKSKGGGREDDEINDIKIRLREYQDNIDLIKSYYSEKDKLSVVDGNGSIEDVTRRVYSILQL